ncbi:MAG: hypothetical protein PWQ85_171 [Geotoga sp.]|jgi:pimeloyl-ACP methyl ester carboxylesterase|nr:hypothetical protein [Geotoga sp.]
MMKVNFDYEKNPFDYSSGYIFKGKHYRCSYITYKTRYKNPKMGTEQVQIYNFKPKGKIFASSLIVHGLGSSNIKFLIWMGRHLASVGINSTILILPGNYTRVDDSSVSGRSFLWPEMNQLVQFWENAVVDLRSTLDLLESLDLWKENNIVIGYCLGGMVSTITAAVDKRISELVLMTTGGSLPEILYRSPTTKFIRRLIDKGFKTDYNLHDVEYINSIYKKNLDKVKTMSAQEIMESDIHPLFKIDPLSYAHLVDPKIITFIEAIFDNTLSRKSRKMLLKEFKGCKYYMIPVGHVTWLPFEYLLAHYILNKLNIKDSKIRTRLLERDKISDNFDNFIHK